MTSDSDKELVKTKLFDSAYVKLESSDYQLYDGYWILRNGGPGTITDDPYKVTKPIALSAGEEICFLFYGNLDNGHYAIGLAANANAAVTSVTGAVLATDGIGGFSGSQQRLVSYKATQDCYVVLCRCNFDADTPIYKCRLTVNTLRDRLSLESDYIFDTEGCNMSTLVSGLSNKTFVIRYNHNISSTSMTMGAGCTLLFLGGSITNGDITFNQTSLQGNVNLKGCTISGSVANSIFNAAWVCYCNGSTSDSAYLNAAINCCNHIFLSAGTYLLESTLQINRSDFTLEGENGAVLKSKSQGLNTKNILNIAPVSYSAGKVSNVTVKGVAFEMTNTYTESSYSANSSVLEQIHAITIRGNEHLTIQDCTFTNIIGDCIYIGLFGGGTSCLHNINVRITGNTMNGNNKPSRNGVSVIDGNSVWIENNSISKISARCMPGAIDIEPNNTDSQIENIYVKNNYINRSRGGVAAIALVIHENACAANNVQISGNTIEFTPTEQGITPRAFYFKLKSSVQSSNVIVTNNTIGSDIIHYFFNVNCVKNLISSNNASN